jgi:hypothetical protein
MLERALPEEVLPPAILDPLLRFKIDCWHSAHNATLRRLRMEGAGISRPLRVMFLVPDTSLWDVYASIYADMAADPQFEPSVLAFQRRGVSVWMPGQRVLFLKRVESHHSLQDLIPASSRRRLRPVMQTCCSIHWAASPIRPRCRSNSPV